MNAIPSTGPRRGPRPVVAALIVVDGLITVLACLFCMPIGVALLFANAIAAAVARGPVRLYFAGIAIVGGLLCIIVAVLLTGVTATTQVGPVTKL